MTYDQHQGHYSVKIENIKRLTKQKLQIKIFPIFQLSLRSSTWEEPSLKSS